MNQQRWAQEVFSSLNVCFLIIGPSIGLLVVIAIFGIWRPSRFLTGDNLINVLMSNYHYAVVAVG